VWFGDVESMAAPSANSGTADGQFIDPRRENSISSTVTNGIGDGKSSTATTPPGPRGQGDGNGGSMAIVVVVGGGTARS